MTPEMKLLEAAIFPDRKSKRVHVADLREAWAVLCRSMEPEEPDPYPVKPSFWSRLFRRKGGLAELDKEIAAYSLPEVRRQAD